MTFNIPVNLMSALAAPPPAPPQNSSTGGDAVSPAGAVAAMQQPAAGGAARDSAGGNTNGQGPSQQQPQATKQSARPTSAQPSVPAAPDRAPATPAKASASSVITAQTQPAQGTDLAAARRTAEANQRTAQTEALIAGIATAPEVPDLVPARQEAAAGVGETTEAQDKTRRASEIDRYAPPDPLPTAPILKAASVYKAAQA